MESRIILYNSETQAFKIILFLMNTMVNNLFFQEFFRKL